MSQDFIRLFGRDYPRHARVYSGSLSPAQRYRRIVQAMDRALSLVQSNERTLHLSLIRLKADAEQMLERESPPDSVDSIELPWENSGSGLLPSP